MKKKYLGKFFSIMLCLALLMSLTSLCGSALSYNETATFPLLNKLNITQGPYGNYSHSGQNAMDFTGSKGYAPFTGTVTRIVASYNAVFFVSNNKVHYADGTYDYMTVLFMHDDNLNSNVSVGAVINKGTYFYDAGEKSPDNNITGAHIHIAVYKGKHASAYGGNWSGGRGSGTVYAYNAFILPLKINITHDNDYNWKRMGDVNFDGKITSADAQKILEFVSESSTPSAIQSILSDVNFDKTTSVVDALKVLRVASGLE